MDLELDLFECPICDLVFQGSIFQCKNGHVVCDGCLVRIHGTCQFCRQPVGDIRCRALENVIAGMALPCSLRSHGCTQLLKHTERRDHEGFLCQHAPFVCPIKCCAYSGLHLYDHIKDAHTTDDYVVVSFARSSWWVWLRRKRPFMMLLDEEDRRVYVLLNGMNVPSGQSGSLTVVCLGPSPAANELLEYKLEVDGGGKPGSLSLSLGGSVPCMRSWAGQYPNWFLPRPAAYWTCFDSIVVNVSVQRSSAVDSSP